MNAPAILIVDDERNIRETVASALEGSSHRIEQAATAERALALLAEQDFDVVFLDLKLPDRSGLEVLRTLQLSHPDVMVIVMTAYGDVETAVEAMRYGAMDFLRKPFSPTALRQSLNAAIAQRSRAVDRVDLDQRLRRARDSIVIGSLPSAEAELRAAIAMDPLNAAAYNLFGIIRELDGKMLDAQLCYRLATTIDRRYAPARANLDRIASWPQTGSIDFGTGEQRHASHD